MATPIKYKTKAKAYEDGLAPLLAGDTGLDPIIQESVNGCKIRFNIPYGGGNEMGYVVLNVAEQPKTYPTDPFTVKVTLDMIHLPAYDLTENAGCDDLFSNNVYRWVAKICGLLQFNTIYKFELE